MGSPQPQSRCITSPGPVHTYCRCTGHRISRCSSTKKGIADRQWSRTVPRLHLVATPKQDSAPTSLVGDGCLMCLLHGRRDGEWMMRISMQRSSSWTSPTWQPPRRTHPARRYESLQIMYGTPSYHCEASCPLQRCRLRKVSGICKGRLLGPQPVLRGAEVPA